MSDKCLAQYISTEQSMTNPPYYKAFRVTYSQWTESNTSHYTQPAPIGRGAELTKKSKLSIKE